jgi:hypothetical protein
VNFLPFEQRMTRDFEAWQGHRPKQEDEHHHRRSLHGHHQRHSVHAHQKGDAPPPAAPPPAAEKRDGALVKGGVEEISRDRISVDELAGLLNVGAVASSHLVRSNSIAY